MKRYWALGAIIVLGLLAAGFYWLEFWAAQSETRVSSQVGTGSSAQAQQLLRTRPAPTLTLFVHGDADVAAALGKELRRELDESPLFAEVVVPATAVDKAAGDVLVVDLKEVATTWTGVYAQAHLTAEVAYSTTGEVAWRETGVMEMSNNGPAVMIDGTYTVDDNSRGLLSRRGYAAYLGQKLGADIARSLLAELQRQTTAQPT